MPWNENTTIKEAREVLGSFLSKTGCSDICAHCPVYPDGEGCCSGCQHLAKGKGCKSPNLSCLSYTCAVLYRHLNRNGLIEDFDELTYGIPREGYRGCQRREDDELMQISDPLGMVMRVAYIPSGSLKEEIVSE